jgi:hypothetical protein
MGHQVLRFLASVRGRRHRRYWHPVASPSFIDTAAAGNLPNVSFIDPAFDTAANGTSPDDHPLADIRLGERFIADAYHALAGAGYLDNRVLVVTFDSTTSTDGQLIPDYTQFGFRVPAIVVSNLAGRRVVHDARSSIASRSSSSRAPSVCCRSLPAMPMRSTCPLSCTPARGRTCRRMRSHQQSGTNAGNWCIGAPQRRQRSVGLATARAVRARTGQRAAER